MKTILNYKKPAFWIIVAVIVACAAVAVCFLTNPPSNTHNYSEVYEATPTDDIQEKYDNEEFVYQKSHYRAADGMWVCEGHTYKYRLEITGRLNNAAKSTTYIVLSNSKDITFDQTWKASGLSSLMSDYFDPEDAVIVGNKLFSS